MARPKSPLLREACPEALTSSTVADGDTVVVQLWGEHDCSNARVLTGILESAAGLDETNLIVDLSKVQFINSATVRALNATNDVLAGQSRTFVLRSPSRCARRVLELCGAGGLIEAAARAGPSPPSFAAAALRTSAFADRVTLQTRATLRDSLAAHNGHLTRPVADGK